MPLPGARSRSASTRAAGCSAPSRPTRRRPSWPRWRSTTSSSRRATGRSGPWQAAPRRRPTAPAASSCSTSGSRAPRPGAGAAGRPPRHHRPPPHPLGAPRPGERGAGRRHRGLGVASTRRRHGRPRGRCSSPTRTPRCGSGRWAVLDPADPATLDLLIARTTPAGRLDSGSRRPSRIRNQPRSGGGVGAGSRSPRRRSRGICGRRGCATWPVGATRRRPSRPPRHTSPTPIRSSR